MLDQLFGHPLAYPLVSSEYVSVSPKKVDERTFLFVAGVGFHRGLAQLPLLMYG
jgi:hypothetical protein